MKFMTFNIRLDLDGQAYAPPPPLPSTFDGELPWSVRKWKVGDTVLLWEPDIVGFQEPFYHQVQDLDAMLGDEYAWVGAGRDDGRQNGEFCPIFYKKDSLAIEDWHTVWLSQTPGKPSQGWDAKHKRIATVARFKRSDGSAFYVLNTHFDHEGVESRKNAAQVILDHIKDYTELTVLFGDLNSPESDGGYVTLTGGQAKQDNDTWKNIDALNEKASLGVAIRTGKPVRTTDSMTLPTHRVVRPGQIMQNLRRHQDGLFIDTRYALETRLTNHDASAPLSGPYGDYDTFTGFGDLPHSRIDYILIKNHQNAVVRRVGVLSNRFDDQLYISDHRPVVAVIDW